MGSPIIHTIGVGSVYEYMVVEMLTVMQQNSIVLIVYYKSVTVSSVKTVIKPTVMDVIVFVYWKGLHVH